MIFRVIDQNINEEADIEALVDEEWAKRLVYTNIAGFAITQDGGLVLLDECGNFVYCPPMRFRVEWLAEV